MKKERKILQIMDTGTPEQRRNGHTLIYTVDGVVRARVPLTLERYQRYGYLDKKQVLAGISFHHHYAWDRIQGAPGYVTTKYGDVRVAPTDSEYVARKVAEAHKICKEIAAALTPEQFSLLCHVAGDDNPMSSLVGKSRAQKDRRAHLALCAALDYVTDYFQL